MSGHVNESMDKDSIMDTEDRIEKIVDIYVTAEAVRDMKQKKDKEDFDDTQTTKTQTPQNTANDSERNKSSRAAVVCLVLLCVLLLTAVIVLCVIFTQERQQLISKNENLTNEREQLILKNTNLTSERKQLISKIGNLTNERNQLILNNTSLTNERDQLKNQLQICVGWTCYNSSFYYKSNEMKNWNESRQDCLNRGADLIIINDRQEQDFVHNMTGAAPVYIGLTDTDVERTWKWIDGTYMTYSFWFSGEPNGGTTENCVMNVAKPPSGWSNSVGWADEPCNRAHQWICEKRLSQLILP